MQGRDLFDGFADHVTSKHREESGTHPPVRLASGLCLLMGSHCFVCDNYFMESCMDISTSDVLKGDTRLQ